MHDTSADIESRVNALFALQTPTQRLKKASSMHASGLLLAQAGVRSMYGDLSSAKMRGHLLVRLYRDCFSTQQLKQIAAKMPDMELPEEFLI